MAVKCLMIETKEKRRYFTLLGNKKNLAEYCRAFGAKMTIVKAEIERKQVLDLSNLVVALCDKNYSNGKIKFEQLKRK